MNTRQRILLIYVEWCRELAFYKLSLFVKVRIYVIRTKVKGFCMGIPARSVKTSNKRKYV